MAVGNNVFDKRTVTRNIAKGLVSDAEYQSHLKNLPDESENAEWVNLDLDDAELTSEDQDDEIEDDETDDMNDEPVAETSSDGETAPISSSDSTTPQGEDH